MPRQIIHGVVGIVYPYVSTDTGNVLSSFIHAQSIVQGWESESWTHMTQLYMSQQNKKQKHVFCDSELNSGFGLEGGWVAGGTVITQVGNGRWG